MPRRPQEGRGAGKRERVGGRKRHARFQAGTHDGRCETPRSPSRASDNAPPECAHRDVWAGEVRAPPWQDPRSRQQRPQARGSPPPRVREPRFAYLPGSRPPRCAREPSSTSGTRSAQSSESAEVRGAQNRATQTRSPGAPPSMTSCRRRSITSLSNSPAKALRSRGYQGPRGICIAPPTSPEGGLMQIRRKVGEAAVGGGFPRGSWKEGLPAAFRQIPTWWKLSCRPSSFCAQWGGRWLRARFSDSPRFA